MESGSVSLILNCGIAKAVGAAARKGADMVTVILIIIEIILFFGMVGNKEEFNKRTYCYGFIACVVAVTVMEIGGELA